MDINFEKTDRLIELMEDSCHALTHFTWQAQNSLQKKRKPLYDNLVKITATSKTNKQKKAERIKAVAKEYKLGNDLEKAEAFLKFQFDEENILKYLTRAYWQIQSLIIFTDNTGSNFADREGLKKLIEKSNPDEPCKDVIVDVVCKQEPRIKDIEKEFWNNCTDTDKINDFCNIYRERWNGHLKKVDIEYYDFDAILFDEKKELHHYFKELRLCGLLQQSERFVECRLMNIAEQINYVSDDVVKLFTTLRSSTNRSIEDCEIILYPKMILLACWLKDGRPTLEEQIESKRGSYTQKVIAIKGKIGRNDFAEFKKFVLHDTTFPNGAQQTFEDYLEKIQSTTYKSLLNQHNLT